MSDRSSRRNFLSAGLAIPAVGFVPGLTGPSPFTAATPPGKPELRYREFGRTGIKVTSVGFGCMITSDPTVIERAADVGINFFDTARGYQGGNNERMVGAALKSKRKDILLCTKSGAGDPEGLARDLDTSLKELGTDHVDVWYLHAKSNIDQIKDDLIEVMENARKQGKIRFTGVSTHSNQSTLLPALAKHPNIDVVLVAYNFTMDAGMKTAVATVSAAGKAVVGMKVMAGGFRRVKPGDANYEKLQKEGAIVAALKWVLDDPNVNTTIPSVTDMDQLDEDLAAMATSFSDSDRDLLARQLDYITPLYCRMCGQCDGTCPQGLPVSDILRHLSYADGYGQFRLGRESYLELAEGIRTVRCKDCSECQVSCPNGVQVAQRLSRAQELFA